MQNHLPSAPTGAPAHWKFAAEMSDMNHDDRISHAEVMAGDKSCSMSLTLSLPFAHRSCVYIGAQKNEDCLATLLFLIPCTRRALSWAGVARMQASASLVGLMPMTIPS